MALSPTKARQTRLAIGLITAHECDPTGEMATDYIAHPDTDLLDLVAGLTMLAVAYAQLKAEEQGETVSAALSRIALDSAAERA